MLRFDSLNESRKHCIVDEAHASEVVASTNILEACRHHEVEHLTYASTSSVYGVRHRDFYQRNRDIPFMRANVGDRYVIEQLRETGWRLGGGITRFATRWRGRGPGPWRDRAADRPDGRADRSRRRLRLPPPRC